MKYLSLFFSILIFVSCGTNQESNSEITEVPDKDTTVVVDSMQFFNDQIALSPTNTDWLYKRAVFLLAKGEAVDAKSDLEKVIEITPDYFEARLLYANLQLSMTNIDSSKIQYEYILEKDSLNTGALIGMSKIYTLVNNFANADAYISAALSADPNSAEAYFMRGIIYRTDFYKTQRQESWDISISSFQTAVEQDPDYYSAYVEMGVMHDEVGSELALEYYNSALDIFPESEEALYNVGMYHQKRNEVDEAINAYQTLNTLDSTWADPYYNQGYIHLVMTQQLDSAIFYFTKATDKDPNYFQAHNNLGLAYEKSGDIENAKKYYGKAIDANPDFQLAKDNLNSLK